MRVFWRNRSIAYCLVLAIATVMLTFDYAGAPVRYRLGAGDEINLTAVTKINQGAGSGLDADKLDGKESTDFVSSGAGGIKDADIDFGLSAGQVNTDDVPEGTANKYFSGKGLKDLTDTPGSYTGQSGKVVAVKSTEDGVEFIASGSGETNTASNVGTGGVGVFKQKVGVDLEHKKINAGSNKVTITDDTGNDEIDIDVAEANIIHDNLSGAGTNTHAQIDTHLGSTSNPHSVTAAQLGAEETANKDAANGYAGLDAGTKVPTARLGGAGADSTKFLRGDQAWAVPAGGGETNTASNVGTGGVGIFKQKTGVDLELKKINAGANVTITDDTGNNEVDIGLSGVELTANKDAANGYAGLDGSSKLTGSQQTYGSAANTACEGNDSRLSDSRAPSGTAGGDLSGTYPNPTIGSAKVTTAMLKTSTGEVSVVSGTAKLTLPGGSYAFYPQIKAGSSSDASRFAGILANLSGTDVITWGAASFPTAYTTMIVLADSGLTLYAQTRYVTASGEDRWIFLLVDKATKEIVSGYQAPDHPAYGNGGDFTKTPHPFEGYDITKYEVVLLDKETCLALQNESAQTGESILTLVNEQYKPQMDREEPYQPLHSGKFITEDNKFVKEMVTTIPASITVRKLTRLTQAEKDTREQKRQQIIQQIADDKQAKEQDRLSAISKLKVLGLSDNEIAALK